MTICKGPSVSTTRSPHKATLRAACAGHGRTQQVPLQSVELWAKPPRPTFQLGVSAPV